MRASAENKSQGTCKEKNLRANAAVRAMRSVLKKITGNQKIMRKKMYLERQALDKATGGVE